MPLPLNILLIVLSDPHPSFSTTISNIILNNVCFLLFHHASGSVVQPLELISAPILPIPTKMSHGAWQVWGNMITTQMDGQNLGRFLEEILWDTLGSVTMRFCSNKLRIGPKVQMLWNRRHWLWCGILAVKEYDIGGLFLFAHSAVY